MQSLIEIQFDKLTTKNTQSNSLRATFGVLADIQYADCEDGHCFRKDKERFYRNSLNLVRQAISEFKRYEKETGIDFKCLIQLGDLIDGKCKIDNKSAKSKHRVLAELDRMFKNESETPNVLHIWGNHEFYNFLRKDLINTNLNTARALKQNLNSDSNNYVYEITDKLKLICLDFYELSLIGYENDDENYLKAKDYFNMIRSKGKRDICRKRDGALSRSQMIWLENELKVCRNSNSKAIICGHVPILSAKENYLALNSEEILELIWKYDDCVLLYLSGHYHPGGYRLDEHSIHHITLPGIIETLPDKNSYMIIDVFDDRIMIKTTFTIL